MIDLRALASSLTEAALLRPLGDEAVKDERIEIVVEAAGRQQAGGRAARELGVPEHDECIGGADHLQRAAVARNRGLVNALAQRPVLQGGEQRLRGGVADRGVGAEEDCGTAVMSGTIGG